MDTNVLLEQVERDIQRRLKLLISQKYGRMFYPYVLLGAAEDIRDIYSTAFRTYFRDFSPRLAEKIHFAALNLTYMLQCCEMPTTLPEVLKMVNKFVTHQLEDYYTWSGDLTVVWSDLSGHPY